MININKLSLANLPTRIHKLERISQDYGKNIYIKRDDETGLEISGNKIRKLEFALREALDQACDSVITCGAVQSNHARATVVAANRLGLKASLFLRGSQDASLEGNYFFDRLLGAQVHIIGPDEYKYKRRELMEAQAQKLAEKGHKAYIIPEGASNGIGSFGYSAAMEEIVQQEENLGISFDAIAITVGSAGSYAGLVYGNKLLGLDKKIIGINICDSAEYFKTRTGEIIKEMDKYQPEALAITREELTILDGYSGLGYGLSSQEEIDFIRDFARKEGIILDPVYTGKAMYGLLSEVEKGSLDQFENLLFIHTGGIFGWTKEARGMLD